MLTYAAFGFVALVAVLAGAIVSDIGREIKADDEAVARLAAGRTRYQASAAEPLYRPRGCEPSRN